MLIGTGPEVLKERNEAAATQSSEGRDVSFACDGDRCARLGSILVCSVMYMLFHEVQIIRIMQILKFMHKHVRTMQLMHTMQIVQSMRIMQCVQIVQIMQISRIMQIMQI